ncbi:hypothetical protein [Vibrio campbellii]|uniref:hypothetical protein n=1 Tax=Vibrio harveyi group TaxID=717610 RepID=UPI00210B0D70|nr:hypothetical protein [Vibrio campbellii]UTZ44568.1 hypothetical protein HB764_25240 [Vibrio campbellii]
MAKVFAVTNENGALTLHTWSSAAAFGKDGNSFLDERFIAIATTNDYRDGMYNELVEQGNVWGIVYTQEQRDAKNMLHEALKAHFKGQTFEQKRY